MRKTILTLGVLLLVPSAFAQQNLPGSQDPLNDICTNFLAQSGQGVSGDSAKLCTCLVRETQSRLTRPEMEIYQQATSKGQAPPDAVMQKVMGIAVQCLTEAG